MAKQTGKTLQIGSLGELRGTYRYYRRGTRDAMPPDLIEDRAAGPKAATFARGDLFRDGATVAWRALALYDEGVDIEIDMRAEVFVDRVCIEQDAEAHSAVAAVEVLVSDDGKAFRKAGRLDAGPSGAIDEPALQVPVGILAQVVVVRLHACYRNIALKAFDIFGCSFNCPVVYPQPASCRFGSAAGALPLAKVRAISVGAKPGDDTRFAAQELAERIAEDFGVDLDIVEGPDASKTSDALSVGLWREHGKRRGRAESYALEVARGKAVLRGADRLGLLYGVETILSLLHQSEGAPALPACQVDDAPAMTLRGAHMGLPPRSEIDFIKRLIRYVLVPMRYNTLFIEVAAGMRFERRPEINEAWEAANRRAARGDMPPVPHGDMVAGGSYLTQDEVRDLVDYAASYGLEVVPEVQSLSHVQFLTVTYPEIAEVPAVQERRRGKIDLNKEDVRPADVYPHCYCALSEKAYEITFDLIDEIVDVFRPRRYVHMGHDEVYQIGQCERCRDRSAAELFAHHVNRCHQYLAGKGLKMAIWADMLHDCTRYETPPAIDMIPKDILLLDFIWYFHLDKDIEPRLLDHGFQVAMGNMYSSHYPRYEARRRQKGIVGAEVSTWVRPDEYTLAYEGKLYDFLYSANMMWSEAYRGELRRTYDRILCDLIPYMRSRLRAQPDPSQTAGARFTPLAIGPKDAGLGETAGLELEPGRHTLRGVPFRIGPSLGVRGGAARHSALPRQAEIAVNRQADSLVFLHAADGHAARIPTEPPQPVAQYVVEYADGKRVRVPVEYGGNIAAWDRPHGEPMAHPIYRHKGYIATYLADPLVRDKTADGRDATVYGYEWINPRPGEKIARVRLDSKGRADIGVLLFALTAVRRGK